MIGPLAAFEALAIADYLTEKQIPTLGVAAAEDMTQRHPSPWFVRLTSTSAQCAYPLAEYSVKELKYKKIVTIADDFAYGHEMCAGFQRAFEDNGGKIIQKIFTPLATPDYGSYVAQVKPADAIFLGTAGSNGFRFLRQFIEYGLKDKMAVIGGMTALDESVLRNMGDEALGILTTSWYSAELDNPLNKSFAPAFRKQFKYDPGYYAASTYVSGEVLEAALKTTKGNVEDKKALMTAIRGNDAQTVRGLVKFDEFGNAIGNVYIRKVSKVDGRLVNSVIKTYPDVTQFWTYDKTAFLQNRSIRATIRRQRTWSRNFISARDPISQHPRTRPADDAVLDHPGTQQPFAWRSVVPAILGFSLIFGLMRLANLTHGAFFMLGTYLAAIALRSYDGFEHLGDRARRRIDGRGHRWPVRTAGSGTLRTNPLGQVLVTLACPSSFRMHA